MALINLLECHSEISAFGQRRVLRVSGLRQLPCRDCLASRNLQRLTQSARMLNCFLYPFLGHVGAPERKGPPERASLLLVLEVRTI